MNNIKWGLAGALVTLSLPAFAATPKIVVNFRGTPLKFAAKLKPYLSQRTVMVPFRETSRLVGAQVSGIAGGKGVTLVYGPDSVYYEAGRHGYKLNGHRVNMRVSSEFKKGHLYVPIRLFNDLTAGKVHAEIL